MKIDWLCRCISTFRAMETLTLLPAQKALSEHSNHSGEHECHLTAGFSNWYTHILKPIG